MIGATSRRRAIVSRSEIVVVVNVFVVVNDDMGWGHIDFWLGKLCVLLYKFLYFVRVCENRATQKFGRRFPIIPNFPISQRARSGENLETTTKIGR